MIKSMLLVLAVALFVLWIFLCIYFGKSMAKAIHKIWKKMFYD